jgi:hypothetical protein
MIRLLCFVLAVVLASSAAAQPVPSPAARPATAKKPPAKKPAAKPAAPVTSTGPCIGVISALGDRFTVQKIGITVFGNDLKELAVPSWGLDDLVVARVRAAAGPGLSVKRVAYAPGAFEPYEHPKIGLFRGRDEILTDVVKQIVGAGGCERYVAVLPMPLQFASTNQTITGVGVVNRSFIRNQTIVFAITEIRVYDGRSLTLLKEGVGGSTGRDDLLDELVNNSTGRARTRVLTDFAWPDQPEAVLTPTMRDMTRAVLGQSLDRALPELLAP